MNLLQKQGIFNSIILYIGVALGFFNLIILFQRHLTIEEIGFFQLLIAVSLLYAQIASLGISNIILRYYSYYRNKDNQHGAFVSFIVFFGLISFIFFTLLFISFKSVILGFYEEKEGAALLIKYYYYIIPTAFFTLVYSILESLARAVFKNVLSAFLKEVLLRIFTSLSILLIIIKWADFNDFVLIYIASNALITLILFYSIYKTRHFKLDAISKEVKRNSMPMINYGVFAVLSGASFVLIQNLDMIMISAMTHESLAFVGIYGTFFGIAVVISLPAKALNRTSYQIISNAWIDKDLTKIGRIYHKTSVVQSVVGCLLFICLIVNRENILFLLKKPEYAQHFDVFIVVAIAFLIDISGGLNSHIINSSDYFKLITLSLILGMIICAIFNILLIPSYGLLGAAVAYLLTIFSLNFSYWLFIKVKFHLQPFDKKHALIIVVSLISLSVGLMLPKVYNFYLDVLVRSGLVSIIYFGLTYLFNISEDINELGKLFFKRK